VARALHIPTIVVPAYPGQFSPAGMLMADLRHDYVRTYYQSLERADFGALERIAGELSADARARVREERSDDARLDLRHSLEMRYAGQDFSMPVPVDSELLARGDREVVVRAFNALHERTFLYHDPAQPLEIVSVRLAAIARRAASPSFTTSDEDRSGRGFARLEPRAPSQSTERRPIWFDAGGAIDCPIYSREQLAP